MQTNLQPREVRRASVINSTVQSNTVSLPRGILTGIQPRIVSGTVPRGRVLVVVELLLDSIVVDTPWVGYVTSAGAPSCHPNIPVPDGMSMRASIIHSSQGSAVDVVVRADVDTSPDAQPGGGSTFYEQPGSGIGELVVIDLGNPAAAANYANQTIAARDQARIRGMSTRLVSSAVAGNRILFVNLSDGTNVVSFTGSTIAQPASQAVDYTMVPGAPSGVASLFTMMALPDYALQPGDIITFTTVALDTLDNWGQGFLVVEILAVPQ